MGYLFTLLAGFTLSIVVLALFSGLILYILGSLGLMQITNKFGSKGSWMAWFPLFNVYLLGKLAFNKGIGWILVILTILSGDVKKSISFNGVTYAKFEQTQTSSLFGLILAIMIFVALYKIYKKLSTKATLMAVFTVLSCGLLAPIFLFAIRNNEVIE